MVIFVLFPAWRGRCSGCSGAQQPATQAYMPSARRRGRTQAMASLAGRRSA
jgi:hypothetical protein